MIEQQDKDLAIARYNHGLECLKDAEDCFKLNKYRNSVNRSYYAIFHFIRALNALNKFDSRKHSGVISRFIYDYVRTGIFDSKISDIISRSFKIRDKSDYDDFYIVSVDEARTQVEDAKYVHSTVRQYLVQNNIILNNQATNFFEVL